MNVLLFGHFEKAAVHRKQRKTQGGRDGKEGENQGSGSASRLIKEMNNPTEQKEQKWKRGGVIPAWLRRHPDFEPYNGKVEAGSKCEELIRKYLRGEYVE